MASAGELRRYWSVIFACSVGLAVSAAPAYITSLGLFLPRYVAAFGWSRGETSLALVVAGSVASLFTPLAGWTIDRTGARPVVLFGCAIFPLALLAYAIVPMSYPIYLILACVAGAAAGIVSPPSYLTLPPQYFERKLGTAIGLAVFGLGLGQMIMPLVTAMFIERLGIKGAWLAMASLVAIVGLPNAWFCIRDNPVYRDRRGAAIGAHLPGRPFAEAIRTPLFWQATVAFMLMVFVTTAITLHLPVILGDRGYTTGEAAAAISLLGAGSLAARLVTGAMLDRVSPVVPAIIFFGSQVVGCFLIRSGLHGPAPYVAALLIGASLGAEGDMMPYMLRRAFGLRAFGRIYGLCFGLFQVGGVSGALFIGLMFDALGSYDRVLALFAGAGVTATLLIIFASRNLPERAMAASSDQRQQ